MVKPTPRIYHGLFAKRPLQEARSQGRGWRIKSERDGTQVGDGGQEATMVGDGETGGSTTQKVSPVKKLARFHLGALVIAPLRPARWGGTLGAPPSD